MNISNAIFAFTEDLINTAEDEAALKNVRLHANIYEEIRPGKTIRTDEIRSAKPVLAGKNVRLDNAIVPLHFLKMPETQKLADKLEARQTATDMANEWLEAYFNDPKLTDADGNHRICNIGEVLWFNEWIKPGTVLIPVVALRLLINPIK